MSVVDARVEILTDPPDPDLIEKTAALLLEGRVAVLPTDTVYALCAAAESERGLALVFEIKGRQESKPLPVFVGGLSQARAVAKLNADAEKLAARFWPGALTLVLERRPRVDWDLGGDPKTVGIRWPNSRFLSDLALRAGPITATSANLTGTEPAKTVAEAISAFADSVDLYVDGGPSPSEVVSTVVCLTGDAKISRVGRIPAEQIMDCLR